MQTLFAISLRSNIIRVSEYHFFEKIYEPLATLGTIYFKKNIIEKETIRFGIVSFSGAREGTWTLTMLLTRPLNERVCRFRHPRIPYAYWLYLPAAFAKLSEVIIPNPRQFVKPFAKLFKIFNTHVQRGINAFQSPSFAYFRAVPVLPHSFKHINSKF